MTLVLSDGRGRTAENYTICEFITFFTQDLDDICGFPTTSASTKEQALGVSNTRHAEPSQ